MINNPFGSAPPAPPPPAAPNPFAPPVLTEAPGPRAPTHGNTQVTNTPMAQAMASPPPGGTVAQAFSVPAPNPFAARPSGMHPALGAPYGQQPVAPADPDDSKNEGQLVQEYIDKRNEKARVAKRHKEELEPIDTRMEDIERKMLARMVRGNVQSLNTEFGSAFQKTTTRYNIEDPDAFLQWVAQNGQEQMLKRDIRQDPVREFCEQYNTVPPGIKVFSQHVVQFRK